MKKYRPEQYTIRNIPTSIDRVLRRQAKESRSRGSGIDTDTIEHNDPDFLIGTWQEDAAVSKALEAQRNIDNILWS